ncbi:MAG: hypothetical protein ACO223_03470 [Burkholderiaceae bacterium]
MSLFEEYLSLGPWLAEADRRDIYKYLLLTRREKYRLDSKALISNRFLESSFANGSISYTLNGRLITYKAKNAAESDYGFEMRTLQLSRIKVLNSSRIRKFFAQAELDVLRNYPNPREEIVEDRGFAISVYAYYDLNYYSKGHGKIIGILSKLRMKDGELLSKLLAS